MLLLDRLGEIADNVEPLQLAFELHAFVQEAAKELTDLVSKTKLDREATLAAAKRVMEIEVQVKYAHMGLLIAIKNELDPGQQKQLGALRE
ncbi:MAG: hypothetical protein QF570_09925 [Myxococcota bacterium]|jgi:Spy/CpxP family protein refolding chaperone|nr:hypothetical protein [Myxococcota bacterium]